jgi:hypothetical protein
VHPAVVTMFFSRECKAKLLAVIIQHSRKGKKIVKQCSGVAQDAEGRLQCSVFQKREFEPVA